jgi:hypothetical protein
LKNVDVDLPRDSIVVFTGVSGSGKSSLAFGTLAVATYTGLFDHVRRIFAATPEARRRHYNAGRFSFNVASGRCPTCEGEGFVMSGWATYGWGNPRQSCPEARPSESSSPPDSSAPTAQTHCTYSTSRPRDCTQPTPTGCW